MCSLTITAYMGRICPKEVLSGFRCIKGVYKRAWISQVEVYERVGKSVIWLKYGVMAVYALHENDKKASSFSDLSIIRASYESL